MFVAVWAIERCTPNHVILDICRLGHKTTTTTTRFITPNNRTKEKHKYVSLSIGDAVPKNAREDEISTDWAGLIGCMCQTIIRTAARLHTTKMSTISGMVGETAKFHKSTRHPRGIRAGCKNTRRRRRRAPGVHGQARRRLVVPSSQRLIQDGREGSLQHSQPVKQKLKA
jgi:hypothetical protein